MNSFIYDIPTKVYFGNDLMEHLGEEISKYGNRVLLLFDGDYVKTNGIYDLIYSFKDRYNFEITEFTEITPNPRHTDIQAGVELSKKENCNVILAVGGGSTMDSAKLIATGSLSEYPIWDLIIGKEHANESLPIIAIPTISATGSEMNTGGVITNLETKDKLSLKLPSQRPKVAFLNPEYTFTVGKYQTACGTIDILCHAVETYFTEDDSMFMLDTFIEGLIRTVFKYGPIAYQNPTNYEARSNLMWASTWAINDFVRYDKIKTWTMHPIEHEISAYYDITHALGLAIIMPRFLKYIIDEKSLKRFRNLGINAFDISNKYSDKEIAFKVIEKIENLAYDTFGLNSNFTQIGITDEYFDEIAIKLTKHEGVFSSGYRDLRYEDIVKILSNCI